MTDDEIKGLFESLRSENAAARAETRREFAAIREESAAAHAETRAAMREEGAAAHAETRRHFGVAIEHIDKRLDLLAETVQFVTTELQRTRTRVVSRPKPWVLCGGGGPSASLPLLNDVTTSPASRRLASDPPALANHPRFWT